MRGKLGPLSPQQEQALEALTRGIIAKIAHGPISELRKQAANTESATTIEAIRSMFRLGAADTEAARARGK
jgi:glutamyl-tRNA reductase